MSAWQGSGACGYLSDGGELLGLRDVGCVCAVLAERALEILVV